MLRVILAAIFLLVSSASAAPIATKQWRSGFETGFPGEWLNYDNGSWTASGTLNPTWVTGWTIVDSSEFSDIPFGKFVYKGWIGAADPAQKSHRAYPGIHSDIPSPLVNRFYVWLDIDYDKMSSDQWVHFATWGNNPDWVVHTMSVRDRKLEMAHLSWSYVGPKPQPDFPTKSWVRFTVYIHYPPQGDGTVLVWQDGVKVLSGKWTSRSGQNLMRAHWGMYAKHSVDHGVQYNDEIQIWSLSEPLTDLENEPPSPYDTPPNTTDASNGDTELADQQQPDLDTPDTSAADVLPPDGSTMDLAPPDTATPDLTVPDNTTPEVAAPDIATADLAAADKSASEVNPPDTSTPDVSVTGDQSAPKPDAATTGDSQQLADAETEISSGGSSCATTDGAPGSGWPIFLFLLLLAAVQQRCWVRTD